MSHLGKGNHLVTSGHEYPDRGFQQLQATVLESTVEEEEKELGENVSFLDVVPP